MNDENTRVVDGLYVSDGTIEGTIFVPGISHADVASIHERRVMGDTMEAGRGQQGSPASDARLTQAGKIARTMAVTLLMAMDVHVGIKIIQRIWAG